MNTINSAHVHNSLQFLADAGTVRTNYLANYDGTELVVSLDYETDSECPIVDASYSSGSPEVILGMTNY